MTQFKAKSAKNSNYVYFKEKDEIRLYIPYERDDIVQPINEKEKLKNNKKESQNYQLEQKIKDKIMQKNIPSQEKENLVKFFKKRQQLVKKNKALRSVYDPTPFEKLIITRNDPITLRQKVGKKIVGKSIEILSDDDNKQKKVRIYTGQSYAEALLQLWQIKLSLRKQDEKYLELNSDDNLTEQITSDGEIQNRKKTISIGDQSDQSLELVKKEYNGKKFSKKRFYADEMGQLLVNEKVFEKNKQKNLGNNQKTEQQNILHEIDFLNNIKITKKEKKKRNDNDDNFDTLQYSKIKGSNQTLGKKSKKQKKNKHKYSSDDSDDYSKESCSSEELSSYAGSSSYDNICISYSNIRKKKKY